MKTEKQWLDNQDSESREHYADRLESELRKFGVDKNLRPFDPVEERIASMEAVLEWEKAESEVLLDVLNKSGIPLFKGKVVRRRSPLVECRELIEHLAKLHICLANTEHLSDEELFQSVVERIIPRLEIRPAVQSATLYTVFVDTYASDYEETYLRFYASSDERSEWKRENPERRLPRKGKLKYKRDKKIMKICEKYRPFGHTAMIKPHERLKRLVLFEGNHPPIEYGVISLV